VFATGRKICLRESLKISSIVREQRLLMSYRIFKLLKIGATEIPCL
jgi:hypothetical protein